MGATTRKRDDDHGIEFIYEEDLVTARDTETGVASSGETRAEALAMLAEALALHENDATQPREDEAEILQDIGLDADEIEAAREENTDPPEFL